MHIKPKNADIKLVLEVWIIVAFILIVFPIFINIDALYDGDSKKLFFSISIFGLIKVLSGYCELIDVGIGIHVSKTKAFIIEYKKLLGVGKNFKPILDLHVLKLNVLIENGSEEDSPLTLFANSFVALISCFVKEWLAYKKPYLKYDLNIKTIEKQRKNIYFETTIVFNIFIILLTFLKFIGEKIIYGIRAR